MNSRIYMLPCILLALNCGGGAAPASSPANTASSQPASDEHSPGMHHPVASAGPTLAADSPITAPAASAEAAPAAPQTPEAKPAQVPVEQAHARGTLSVTVTSTPASAAKQAVVYIEDAPKDRDISGSMDNRQMAFVPYILVVTAGSKVTFTNSDPFPHNVFSPDNEKWDMGVVPAKGAKVRKFEKPGSYTVLCNMHPNMKAHIVVVPSSYFAKADKSGEAMIKDIPAGRHDVVVWAPGVKPERKEIVIDSDKTLAVELHK